MKYGEEPIQKIFEKNHDFTIRGSSLFFRGSGMDSEVMMMSLMSLYDFIIFN